MKKQNSIETRKSFYPCKPFIIKFLFLTTSNLFMRSFFLLFTLLIILHSIRWKCLCCSFQLFRAQNGFCGRRRRNYKFIVLFRWEQHILILSWDRQKKKYAHNKNHIKFAREGKSRLNLWSLTICDVKRGAVWETFLKTIFVQKSFNCFFLKVS